MGYSSKTGTNELHSVERILINGARQYIAIRSDDTQNPLVLYLHGGPGTSELPLLRHYQSDMEQYCTQVYWEQRGTAKSYRPFVDKSTYNINQFVSDAYEISQYCLSRLGKRKMHIVAHSWGTIIGVKLIAAHPELFASYTGIGQIACMHAAEQIGHRFTLEAARRAGDARAVRQLQKVDHPPYLTVENNPHWFAQLQVQRKWLTYFGGDIHNQKNYNAVAKIFLKSKEYSLLDIVRFALGSRKSLMLMWPEIMKVDFLDQAPYFAVPVYFLEGKHDFNCSSVLARKFYDGISAPKKGFTLFENSGHNPIFEECAKFSAVLREILAENEPMTGVD